MPNADGTLTLADFVAIRDGLVSDPGISGAGASPYGLTIGRGGAVVPVSPRGHAAFDNQDVVNNALMFRQFWPLIDPAVGSVLPGLGNGQSFNGVGGDSAAGVAPLQVACAVETSDGQLLPFTFGGQHLATVNAGDLVLADTALAFGAQVTTTDKYGVTIPQGGVWLRVFVSLAATYQTRARTVGITSGSAAVTDTAAVATDAGAPIVGTGIPANAYIALGSVTPGAGYTLALASTGAALNATATNAALSASLKGPIPLNLGTFANADAIATGGNATDLTLPGSGAVPANAGSYYYGPTVLLGRLKTRKPIVGVWSDSIFAGYGDDFHSPFYGPIRRAAQALGLPLVGLQRGGESAGTVTAPAGRRHRANYLDGITDLILEIGTNDGQLTTAAGAGGVTTMLNRLITMGNYFAGLGARVHVCTLPPRTTSTDGWATTVNQTPATGSQIAQLASCNDQLRAKPAPFSSVLDLADLCMSSRNSGLWVPGGTGDGVHPSDGLNRGSITTTAQALMATFRL